MIHPTPPVIENWAFAQIPQPGRSKHIVALLGTVNGKFTESWPLRSVSRSSGLATDKKGNVYQLGDPDPAMLTNGMSPIDWLKHHVVNK